MDPLEELLLGPAFAIAGVLDRTGVKLDDIGVVEIHEAFAAQVLASVRLLADEILTMASPRELGGRIDELRVAIDAVRETTDEIQPFEEDKESRGHEEGHR